MIRSLGLPQLLTIFVAVTLTWWFLGRPRNGRL
jgi:hypothetical protein